jgi:hypothetical protein
MFAPELFQIPVLGLNRLAGPNELLDGVIERLYLEAEVALADLPSVPGLGHGADSVDTDSLGGGCGVSKRRHPRSIGGARGNNHPFV